MPSIHKYRSLAAESICIDNKLLFGPYMQSRRIAVEMYVIDRR